MEIGYIQAVTVKIWHESNRFYADCDERLCHCFCFSSKVIITISVSLFLRVQYIGVWHEDLKSRKIEIGTVKFDCVKRDSFFTQIVQELSGSSRKGLSQGFQETMTESSTRNRAIYIFVAVCHVVVLWCIGLQFILTMAKDSKIVLNKFERIQRERAVRGLENAVDQH